MRWWLHAFLVAVASARVAFAEGVEPVRVDYAAPPSCPDANAFFREVTARSSRVGAARGEEPARVLRVSIRPSEGGYTARLVIDDGDVSSTPREVNGTTCREVVEAAGLIAALAIDPAASIAAPHPPEPVPSAPPGPQPEPRPLRPRFGAGLDVEGAFIAGLVGTGRLFGDVELTRDERLFAPSMRMSLSRSLDVPRHPATGHASLRFTTVAAALCPLRLAAGSFELRPCVEGAGGVLDAQGSGVPTPHDRTRPWASIGTHVRLMWSLARFFALEVEIGAIAPLFRETFFFEPSTRVYESPPVAGFGRAGASVRFP